jgi:large subunit ribosomal protein L25
METSTINAAVRTNSGKGHARKIRSTGSIPATVYGGSATPQSLVMDPGQLAQLRRASLGWNTPVSLQVEGGTNVPLAMLRDVQKHPLTGAYLHADFLCVDEAKLVQVDVRIDLVGRAAGVALGGRLSRPVRHITVRCLPKNIPVSVEIEISALNVGDSVMIDELDLGDGVEAVFKVRSPVVAVVGRRGGAQEEEAEEEEAEEEAE